MWLSMVLALHTGNAKQTLAIRRGLPMTGLRSLTGKEDARNVVRMCEPRTAHVAG
jgi:hypothetical protein